MLMAAGLGTRLRPFTDLESKVLLPLMGVPCAQFAIDALAAAGVGKIVANVHHHAAQAKEGLERLDWGGAEFVVSDESERLLGSAGGLAKARQHFDGKRFFLINADVLTDVDLKKLAQRHHLLRERHGVRLTLTVLPKPEGTGSYREILMDEESGLVEGLGQVVPGKPYFASAAVIEPEALDGISTDEPSEFVPRILEPAIRDGKAGFHLTSANWFDIGSPALWSHAHVELMSLLETGQIPALWRKRIEAVSQRIGTRMWISKNAKRSFPTADWWSPAYFNHLQDTTAQPPREFGPNAVLYGDAHSYRGRLQDAIGYRGLFQKFRNE
jgi:mannose-1-phosphate guanylyltransferase